MPFTYDDDVVKLDRQPLHRARERRPHDRRDPDQHVLPQISQEFLKRMMEGKPIERVHVTVEGGDFAYAFE